MKKVALCYSGQIRDMKKSLSTQLKHLILPNSEFCEFFVFGHFWHDSKLNGKLHWEQQPQRGSFNDENVVDFMSLKPTAFSIEIPFSFNTDITPDPRFPHPIENVLSMFLSMSKCSKILESFSKERNIVFDTVVRMRSDLYFYHDVNFSNIDPDSVYIHKTPLHLEYGVKDTFAYGSQKNMLEFFDVYDNIIPMHKEGCAINPECLLGYHLRKKDLKLNRDFVFHNNICRVARDV